MPPFSDCLIDTPVELSRGDLRAMMHLARSLFHLSRLPAYRDLIAPEAPPIAAFDPRHDAVMMGYDFHLDSQGPRLIEVNTNAGGGLLAILSHGASDLTAAGALPRRLREKILSPFYQEMYRYSGGRSRRPGRIAIIDEEPGGQFLYPEMQGFQRLFEQDGVSTAIIDPTEVEEREEGLFHQGEMLDLIYNRHCDFYLETPTMQPIARAYAGGRVCLTPNPFAYGLLGDKRRMALWSDEKVLRALPLKEAEIHRILDAVPYTRLLAELGREDAWKKRKNLVFKPVTRFGSRGVYMGASISRTRFDSLPPDQTLAQTLVPPSLTQVASQERPMKTDFRLYAYRTHILGVTARLYHGQVTNMQSPGSGFAPVRIRD
ncbi:hypothetical protein L9S41_03925 [Geoalkalibacter halelectricus]|uniref:Circularly permuted type 2 ATP-grasp protein n=1 Tax=Geoalkalibacter halelectricus TaxID=2847045 RepID=A0ABY5ZS94_9BACT|nr:hypothetical protein [Geoalkalibacter halelectricus]UWZ80554.1 hypothetical protein L9S41_03925 [Geoalkalibacter halelectricus]